MPRVDRSQCPVGCLAPSNSLGLCTVHGVGHGLVAWQEQQARKAATVKPVEAYVDGDKLIQVFEYVDGPKKGERFKLATLMVPISKVEP